MYFSTRYMLPDQRMGNEVLDSHNGCALHYSAKRIRSVLQHHQLHVCLLNPCHWGKTLHRFHNVSLGKAKFPLSLMASKGFWRFPGICRVYPGIPGSHALRISPVQVSWGTCYPSLLLDLVGRPALNEKSFQATSTHQKWFILYDELHSPLWWTNHICICKNLFDLPHTIWSNQS